ASSATSAEASISQCELRTTESTSAVRQASVASASPVWKNSCRARSQDDVSLAAIAHSERGISSVVVADSNCLRHVVDAKPAIAVFSCTGSGGECLDRFFGAVGRDDQLHLHFREEVHVVLLAAIDFAVPFLTPVAAHLGDRHPIDADTLERFLDL